MSNTGNWVSDTKRSDGLYVHKLPTNNWAIHYQGVTVAACPCCDNPMPSRRIARLVADAAYPPVATQ